MSDIQTNAPVNPENKSGLATAALVLGIIGIVLSIILPGLGIICDILAIIFGGIGISKNKKEPITNATSAKVGLILGIVGVIIAVIMFIVAAALIASIMGNLPAPPK